MPCLCRSSGSLGFSEAWPHPAHTAWGGGGGGGGGGREEGTDQIIALSNSLLVPYNISRLQLSLTCNYYIIRGDKEGEWDGGRELGRVGRR